MPPPVSYYEIYKTTTDREGLRKKLLEHLAQNSGNKTRTAREFGTTTKTINKWLNRESLKDRVRAPQTCPHKTDKTIEDIVDEYMKGHPWAGQDRVKLDLNLSSSTSVINRIMHEKGYITPRKKKYQRKHQVARYRRALKAFELWEFDPKYLDDIPNLVAPLHQGTAPRFELTLRDVVSGTTFLGYVDHLSLWSNTLFIFMVLYHMRLHGIDTHYLTVQTDNGSEIIGNILAKQDSIFVRMVEDMFGATYRSIPAATPRFNGCVESFHNRIEDELYDWMRVRSRSGFFAQVQKFQNNWNLNRKALKTKKTPLVIAREHGNLVPKCFVTYPVLQYDTIPVTMSHILAGGYHLPDETSFVSG